MLNVGPQRVVEGNLVQLARSERNQRRRVITSGREEGDYLH